MARAIWSGAISFGLVNIPVKLFSAVSRKNVRFNQLDGRTGARVKQKRVSAEDGSEVSYDDIVKGYELSSGEYVIVTDDELAALDPEAVRTIEILEFVDLADIDPIYYDAAYYLVPDQATVKPYKLLATAMEEAGRVGLARFVMRSKQYLAAVRPKDGKLLLSTMAYADEVVSPSEIGGFDHLDDVELSEAERTMASQLIDSLAADFEPERFEDTHRNEVLALIERKAAGDDEVVPAPSAPAKDTVIDLMAALEASVAEAKAARSRHPSKSAASKKPAKKRAASTSAKRTAKRKSA